MSRQDLQDFSSRIDAVGKRLESHRRTRRRVWLPETLWEEAVELARAGGVSLIARTLRLDYYSLKRRLQSSKPAGKPKESGSPASFVEIEFPPRHEFPECMIQVEDVSGCRLTVQLPASCAGEMAAVASALWRHKS